MLFWWEFTLPHHCQWPYYKESEIYNGISMVEDCILEVIRLIGEQPFVILGNLRVRTAAENVWHSDEVFEHMATNTEWCAAESTCQYNGTSADTGIKSFGRYLWQVCIEFHILLLRISLLEMFSLSFTHISSTGCSVIHYTIVLISFNVIPRTESKQILAELHLSLKFDNAKLKRKSKSYGYEKYVWNKAKVDELKLRLHSEKL